MCPPPFCPPSHDILFLEINNRDYRAWYGLGQTYELLKMPHYAIYYYQKGITLRYGLLCSLLFPLLIPTTCLSFRPYDARIWCAMAACYEEVGRVSDAIKCYERAESYSEGEVISHTMID